MDLPDYIAGLKQYRKGPQEKENQETKKNRQEMTRTIEPGGTV